MKFIYRSIGRLLESWQKVYWFLWRNYQKSNFAACGKKVYIGRYCTFTYSSISVGNDVYIGSNAVFQSAHGRIIIGDHVMFGPHVHIHGGNHVYDTVGVYMKRVTDKAPESDGTIRICDDVWVGSNVTILKGVTIGEGSIIAAGCVITKDVEPYTIVVGSLPRKVFKRWDDETVARHKQILSGSNRSQDA